MTPMILFGAGGHGKVALDAALCAGIPVAVVVDGKPEVDHLLGISVVASATNEWLELRQFRFLVTVGGNDIWY